MIEPTKKSRQRGRILPSIWLHNRTRYPWRIFYDNGCAICHRGYYLATEENGRVFCWYHHPNRAQALLAGEWDPNPQLAKPNRKTCERILKLAGRTQPAPKPPRPKKRPRDRRYVR